MDKQIVAYPYNRKLLNNKINEQIHAMTWFNLKSIRLNERSETKNVTIQPDLYKILERSKSDW